MLQLFPLSLGISEATFNYIKSPAQVSSYTSSPTSPSISLLSTLTCYGCFERGLFQHFLPETLSQKMPGTELTILYMQIMYSAPYLAKTPAVIQQCIELLLIERHSLCELVCSHQGCMCGCHDLHNRHCPFQVAMILRIAVAVSTTPTLVLIDSTPVLLAVNLGSALGISELFTWELLEVRNGS